MLNKANPHDDFRGSLYSHAAAQNLKLEGVTRLYKSALLASAALTPLLAIWYLVTFSASPPLRFESHEFHVFVIAVATLVSGFISYVSWRSYQASGEVFLRWLTAGFLAFTLIYLPHGLFTPLAHDNIWLFLLYGPTSRLIMLGCLVYGLMQYGKPPENPAEVSRRGFWRHILIGCVVINVAVAVLAYSPIADSAWVRTTMESGALSLAAIGIIVMKFRRISSPLMVLYAVGLACFGQAAIAFMLAKPWNHLWWLAHIIFAGGFFILSWGVTRALLTTRSFSRAYNEEQMMRALQQEKEQTLAALHDLQASIVERDLLQKQTVHAQKMQAIGQLTGGIAHEFNNMLASILGYVELALERCVPDKDSKLAGYLNAVQSTGYRARNLILNMLAFSRGSHGVAEKLAAAPLLADVVKLLRAVIPSNVEIVTTIAPDLPDLVMDPAHLRLMLMNLCINSRDAVGPNGRIEISLTYSALEKATCASCHTAVDGQYLALSVHDNGSGITPENLLHIFEPFFSTKEVGKGTGMGLSTVHGLVHGYHGHIVVASTPETGTTVRLLLPVTVPHDQ